MVNVNDLRMDIGLKLQKCVEEAVRRKFYTEAKAAMKDAVLRFSGIQVQDAS